MLDREVIDVTKVANVVLKYANNDSTLQIGIHRVDNDVYDAVEVEEKCADEPSDTRWKEIKVQDKFKVVLFPKRLDENG